MSQQQDHEYHPHEQEHIFGFSNGFDRSEGDQIHRPNNKLRRFEPTSLVPLSQQAPPPEGLNPVYERGGMLSEMFNYGQAQGPTPPAEILDYRRGGGGLGQEWYGGSRQVERQQHVTTSHHQMGSSTINADSAAAMQLFMTNPPPRSPSPPQPTASSSTLHMLLPNPNPNPSNMEPSGGGFSANFWGTGAHISNPGEVLGGIVEGQGLSLSLSSSLQHLEAAKQAQELRTIGGGEGHNIMFFNHHHNSTSTTTSSPAHFFNNVQHQQHPIIHNLQGFGLGSCSGSGSGAGSSQHQVHLGFGPASPSSSNLGMVNVLRTSRYVKPAQELLEEFCSVGRGHLKKTKLTRQNSSGGGGCGGGGDTPSSSAKDPPQLSASDRIEHQRRKVKLLAMLDEVERRYNNYCEQMQMVVNSFDMVMGYGSAMPYTGLAQKAMSRHFRCLKDAIHAQVKQSCEVLGEKDPTAASGLTKGETPRLKLLEQSLRQQRAFHQLGMNMTEQEAWRPQRGLPERSVNLLRSWLFEHFLHPYPSDADKHTLARQTGLSRNQVSNWFINARVRLWKPMVEEMYQQESKEAEDEDEDEDDVEERDRNKSNSCSTNTNTNSFTTPQNSMPSSSAITDSTTTTLLSTEPKRTAETMTPSAPPNSDPSLHAINRHLHHHHHHQQQQPPPSALPSAASQPYFGVDAAAPPDNVGSTTMIRFGTSTGDVSLTLGLRHAGNAPDKAPAFSVRDFGSC